MQSEQTIDEENKDLFDAFEAYDNGTYKRSMLVDCKPKNVNKKRNQKLLSDNGQVDLAGRQPAQTIQNQTN